MHSGSVFNGPVYKMNLGSVGGSLLFDRVTIDLTDNDGPELYDNVAFNTLAVPEPATGLFLVLAAALGSSSVRAQWRWQRISTYLSFGKKTARISKAAIRVARPVPRSGLRAPRHNPEG